MPRVGAVAQTSAIVGSFVGLLFFLKQRRGGWPWLLTSAFFFLNGFLQMFVDRADRTPPLTQSIASIGRAPAFPPVDNAMPTVARKPNIAPLSQQLPARIRWVSGYFAIGGAIGVAAALIGAGALFFDLGVVSTALHAKPWMPLVALASAAGRSSRSSPCFPRSCRR